MGYVEDLRKLVGHRRLILCGSSVVVEDTEGRLLLQRRTYPEGRWCFPGGLMELGEAAEDTARREVFEETALELGQLRLIGVYSGPNSLCRAKNGDEWFVVTLAYACRDWRGEARINDGESAELCWFSPQGMPETLVSSHKKILADYLRQEEKKIKDKSEK